MARSASQPSYVNFIYAVSIWVTCSQGSVSPLKALFLASTPRAILLSLGKADLLESPGQRALVGTLIVPRRRVCRASQRIGKDGLLRDRQPTESGFCFLGSQIAVSTTLLQRVLEWSWRTGWMRHCGVAQAELCTLCFQIVWRPHGRYVLVSRELGGLRRRAG